MFFPQGADNSPGNEQYLSEQGRLTLLEEFESLLGLCPLTISGQSLLSFLVAGLTDVGMPLIGDNTRVLKFSLMEEPVTPVTEPVFMVVSHDFLSSLLLRFQRPIVKKTSFPPGSEDPRGIPMTPFCSQARDWPGRPCHDSYDLSQALRANLRPKLLMSSFASALAALSDFA